MSTTPANATEEPKAIQRILFCTDFSANADYAFGYATAAAAARPGACIHLLHVIPEPEAQFWKTYVYEVEGVDDKARRDIDERTAIYRLRLPAGVRLETIYRIGRDYEEILRYAGEGDIDLIVMGRQGHSAIHAMFFGSVTEKVVRHAACPVLVIPVSPPPPATPA